MPSLALAISKITLWFCQVSRLGYGDGVTGIYYILGAP